MNKISLGIGVSLLVLLVVVSVSLSTNSSSFTGNVVAEGTSFSNSYSPYCVDSDGGYNSAVAGVVRSISGGRVLYSVDICEGKTIQYYDLSGKVVTGKTQIREFYCNGSAQSDLKDSTDSELGGGYCVSETVLSEGINKTAGKWVTITSFCNETSDGVITSRGRFRNSCSGRTYVEYSCNGSIKMASTLNCSNRCDATKSGCVGTCAGETDTENNMNVAGNLTVDGVGMPDRCRGSSYVKQYTCVNNAVASLPSQYCGDSTIRRCVETAGGARCENRFAGSGTEATLSSLSEALAALEARVSALEAASAPSTSG